MDAAADVVALRPILHPASLPDDGRWALLAELAERAAPGGEPEAPFAVRASPPVGFGNGAPPLLWEPIQVTFDRRMSRQLVEKALRQVWPLLRERGITRQTHPLSERRLQLIRHVCLTMPDASWPERWRQWNREHDAWVYLDVRAYQTAFHRAEVSLAGGPDGLRWFYDPLARLSPVELKTEAAAGNRWAKRLIDSRKQAWRDSLREHGIAYIEERS